MKIKAWKLDWKGAFPMPSSPADSEIETVTLEANSEAPELHLIRVNDDIYRIESPISV